MMKDTLFLCFGLGFALLSGGCRQTRSGALAQNSQSTADTAGTAPDNGIETQLSRPGYNVYIDYSGSMRGYMDRGSDFSSAVSEVITRLSGLSDSVSLSFVNNRVCSVFPQVSPGNIHQIAYNLQDLKSPGEACTTGSTDVPQMIDTVLDRGPGNDVEVVVTDCILSLNGLGIQNLPAQKSTVFYLLSKHLQARKFSTLVVQMSSGYNHDYYSESDGGKPIDVGTGRVRRPYYLLVFGPPGAIDQVLRSVDFHNIKGFQNSYYLLVPHSREFRGEVLRRDKIGQFRMDGAATSMVLDEAQPARAPGEPAVFQFSAALDLGDFKGPYLLDPGNYEVPPNYRIVGIQPIDPQTQDPSLLGFTHIFTLSTSQLELTEDVYIRLKPKMPTWVDTCSNEDDSAPLDLTQQHQTFGLKWLLAGVQEAYKGRFGNEPLGHASVMVSTGAEASGTAGRSTGPWLIVVGLFILVGIFIWLKNKK